MGDSDLIIEARGPMFAGYGELYAYGRQSVPDALAKVFTDEALLTERVAWPNKFAERADLVVMAEFSEIHGPKPLFVHPAVVDSRSLDELVLRLMSASQHADSGLLAFHLRPDSLLMLTEHASSFYGIVCYATFHDLHARGYVRPFCVGYFTHDLFKALRHGDIVRRYLDAAARLLKLTNTKVFAHDLRQNIMDLLLTRSEFARNAPRLATLVAGPTPGPAQGPTVWDGVDSDDAYDEAIQQIRDLCQLAEHTLDATHVDDVIGAFNDVFGGIDSASISEVRKYMTDTELPYSEPKLVAVDNKSRFVKSLRPLNELCPFAGVLVCHLLRGLMERLSADALKTEFYRELSDCAALQTALKRTAPSRFGTVGQLDACAAASSPLACSGLAADASDAAGNGDGDGAGGELSFGSLMSALSELPTRPASLDEEGLLSDDLISGSDGMFLSAYSSYTTPAPSSPPTPPPIRDPPGAFDDEPPIIVSTCRVADVGSPVDSISVQSVALTTPTLQPQLSVYSINSADSWASSLELIDYPTSSFLTGRPTARFSLDWPEPMQQLLPMGLAMNAEDCFSGCLLRSMSRYSCLRDVIEALLMGRRIAVIAVAKYQNFVMDLICCLSIFLPRLNDWSTDVVPWMDDLGGCPAEVLAQKYLVGGVVSQGQRVPSSDMLVFDVSNAKFSGPPSVSNLVRAFCSRHKHYKFETCYFKYVLSALMELRATTQLLHLSSQVYCAAAADAAGAALAASGGRALNESLLTTVPAADRGLFAHLVRTLELLAAPAA